MDNYNNQQQTNQQINQQYSQPYGQYPIAPKTGWNWGAFVLQLPFAFGNKTYLPLLLFLGMIPIVGWIFSLVWVFVCGACASGWVWKKGTYRTVSEFNAAMDSWNRAGLVMFIIALAGVVLTMLIFMIFGIGLMGAFGASSLLR